MGLLTRIYFNAVFGALGGLLGWMLFSLFGNQTASEGALVRQLLQDGALIGAGIGYLVVSGDAVRDRSWLRFARQAAVGAVLGAIGGAVGMFLAERVNFALVGGIGAIRGSTVKFLLTVATRGVGFLFLGMAVGVSEGIAARSLGKLGYGTLGGTLGGFLGGCLFGLVYLVTLQRGGDAAFAGAAGLAIMGACIGALSALVQGVFQPASVRVLRGWQEGREYPLDRPATVLGRDEGADIALFRDMRVEKRHAELVREGDGYLLRNRGAAPEWTRVNDVPVASACELHDGDRIQLGNVVLRFQRRAARPRPGAVATAPVARQVQPT
ncbi:MAG: FHA domain-containing protein [Gemmataceae bacterium]